MTCANSGSENIIQVVIIKAYNYKFEDGANQEK